MISRRFAVALFLSLLTLQFSAQATPQPSENFFVVFPNWLNVKTTFGAKGDGKSDDTKSFQTALDSLRTDKSSRVLYIPSGTYRLTQAIRIQSARGFAIMGEDPSTTTLTWDGPTNTDMVWVTGCGGTRIGRLTIDGAGKARRGLWHDWAGGDFFPTNMEDCDIFFKNLVIGVQGGEYPSISGKQSTAAEVVVIRCTFNRCLKGVVLDDFNTVDWFVRQCRFEDNGSGVYIEAGTACVYNCVFKRSTMSDIYQAHSEFTAIRNNYSIDSRRFYEQGGPSNWSYRITLQGNTILDPQSPIAILIPNSGPILLMDNIIRSSTSEVDQVTFLGSSLKGDLISIHNTFTVPTYHQIAAGVNRVRQIGDTVVDRKSINIQEPTHPSTPMKIRGPIVELNGFTGQAIQQAIDQAAKMYTGKKAIIHIKAGEYAVTSPIILPAYSDARLIGDVGRLEGPSKLVWKSEKPGSLIIVKGPSKTYINDLYLLGNRVANGIVVENADQVGSHVFLDQINTNIYSGTNIGIGLVLDKLDNTFVEGWHFYPGAQKGGILVIGGQKTAKGEKTTARMDVFGGNAGGFADSPVFDVQNNGRLIVEDLWWETGKDRSPTIRLTEKSSGTLTLHTGKNQYHTLAAKGIPTHQVENFKGRCAIIGINVYDGSIKIGGMETKQNSLFIGNYFGPNGGYPTESDPGVPFVQTADSTKNCIINNCTIDEGGKKGICSTWYPDAGKPTDAWILSMLEQTRTEKPTQNFEDLPAGVTDVRMFRIGMDNCVDGIRIEGGLKK